MKGTLAIFAVACLLLAPLAGCGSETITAWAARGSGGTFNQEHNIDEWHALALSFLAEQRQAAVDAAYSDLRAVVGGALKNADGTPIPLDSQYLMESQVALHMSLNAVEQKVKAIRAMREDDYANVRSTREVFDKIAQLNKLWVGAADELGPQLARIAAELAELRNGD